MSDQQQLLADIVAENVGTDLFSRYVVSLDKNDPVLQNLASLQIPTVQSLLNAKQVCEHIRRWGRTVINYQPATIDPRVLHVKKMDEKEALIVRMEYQLVKHGGVKYGGGGLYVRFGQCP